MTAAERTLWVAKQARTLGFDLCGVAPVDGLDELARLPEWLDRGYAGEMRYLHDPRRADPARALDGAQSIIVCALNYNTPLPYSTEATGAQHPSASLRTGAAPLREADGPRGWMSRYAWGDDYHEILGAKLDALVAAMREHFAEPFEARAYVDTGPIVERVAAKHAGLGWLAKNTCFINEQLGSWLFLGVIITTLDLAPSLGPAEAPPPDLCGNCRQCIDACPTGALVEPYVLDARRCISYLTIELRGSIPLELREPMGRMVFGCDICQDVCPWNRKAPTTTEPRFQPRRFESSPVGALLAAPNPENQNAKSRGPGMPDEPAALETRRDAACAHVGAGLAPPLSSQGSLFVPSLEWLASLSEDDFRELFRGSAIKRTRWRGLVRNACVALGDAFAGSSPAPVSGVRWSPPESEHRTTRHSSLPHVVALLKRLAASDDSIIAEHAQWALQRLQGG